MALTPVPINDLGGVISDPQPRSLPPNIFNKLYNCKILNGAIVPALGHDQLLDTPSASPYFLFDQIISNNQVWFYGTDTKIYQTDGTTSSDVTRLVGGNYTTTSTIGWDGGVLNGVAYFTNGVDVPQYKTTGMSEFANLTAFPANTVAKYIRAFGNRIVALGISESGNESPYSVLISDQADPGTIPTSWDSTDPTNLANRIELSDTPGPIVDAAMMNGSLYVYKTDSIWRITFTGGVFVDRVERVLGANGALAPNCVKEFENNHFVIGIGDIYVHNGVAKTSIFSQKNALTFFSEIDPDYAQRAFVIRDTIRSEMIICIPTRGTNGACDIGYIWNWKTDNVGSIVLPHIRYGYETTISPSTIDAWSTSPGVGTQEWDAASSIWNTGNFNPDNRQLVVTSYVNTKHYWISDYTVNNSVDDNWYALREDIQLGDEIVDKIVDRVIPYVDCQSDTTGVQLDVRVGGRSKLSGSVSWSPITSFRVGTDYKADMRVLGKYISVQFAGKVYNKTRVSGYTLYTVTSGGR